MDQRLSITLEIDKFGNLVINDSTDYSQLDYVLDHILVERVLNNELDVVFTRMLTVTPDNIFPLVESEPIPLPYDGLFTYQRLLVPLKDHPSENDYYYNNGRFYTINGNGVTLNEIWENRLDSSNIFWFDDQVFSIYDLMECFVLNEKDRLDNLLKNGCKSGCVNSDKGQTADFLAAVLFVITHYVEIGEVYEAQALLNQLKVCNGLCSKQVSQTKGCGCNGKTI